jgi:hypothetical protein
VIIRSPRPERGFTILPNILIEDARLSFRARGILVWLLAKPDNWRTDYRGIALAGKEGEKAVRAALRELRDVGFIRSVRSQDQRGRWSTATFVYETPQPSGREPSGGKGGFGEPPPIARTETKDSAVQCPAILAGDDATTGFQDWRTEDKILFADLLDCDTLTSNGSKWTEGTYNLEQFYDAWRKPSQGSRKPLDWPGRLLEAIADSGGPSGIDSWLDRQGLERSYRHLTAPVSA